MVHVASWNSNLYAVNPDGTEKWPFKTGDNVRSWPAIGGDGTIYVGSDVNTLYAVNVDGSEKWTFETGHSILYTSPAIGEDGTIYVGSTDGNLYAIGEGEFAEKEDESGFLSNHWWQITLIVICAVIAVVVGLIWSKRKTPQQPSQKTQGPLSFQGGAQKQPFSATESDTIHCINCGTANDPNNEVCQGCGERMDDTRIYADEGTNEY